MQTITNTDYPNRIQLLLDSVSGPLTSSQLGAFSPDRDLEIYINGLLTAVESYVFDASNNRYLIYLTSTINSGDTVQVIHHAPHPNFMSSSSVVGRLGNST